MCIKCGAFFGKPTPPTAEAAMLALAQPPAPDLLKPLRPYFINRQWLTDWVFWVAVVLVSVGGARNSYREGANGLLEATSATYISGVFTILFMVPIGFIMFGVLPALIRWPFRKRRFNKLLAIRPDDEIEGWKPDPFDPAVQRWWAGSFWSQGARPQKDVTVGAASWAVIAGVFVALFLAFLLGTVNRGFGDAPDLANVNVQSLLNNFDQETLEGMNPNQVFATAVADAYFRTEEGLKDYYAFEATDPSDPISQFIELEVILNELQASQGDLQRLLTPAITQEQIGGLPSPDVDALRAFSTAIGAFASSQLGFINALGDCEPLSAPGREFGACDENAFAIWEAPMTKALAPLAASYQKVLDSLKDV